MTKDWAITAWGENGTVQVEIKELNFSDQFPFVTKDDSRLPENEGRSNSSDGTSNIETEEI